MLRYRHDGHKQESTTSDLRQNGKAESMIKENHINTLIYAKSSVNEMYDDTVLLCDRKNLTKVVYNDSDDITLYCLNDFNVIERAQDTVTENQFSELFYDAEDLENPNMDDAEYYESMYHDEPRAYIKADWQNHEHYVRYTSEHGINHTNYDFRTNHTNYDFSEEDEEDIIMSGVCYEASDLIEQDYPRTHQQRFFKFVANSGEVYYVKETKPFYIDELDYVYELITKEEFASHDNEE